RARRPRARRRASCVRRGSRRRGRDGPAVSALVIATVRDDIANFVSTLVTVYIVLIFIRILMSWFTRIPYYRWLDVVLRFVTDVTDPYLNIFRRFIPPIRLGPGALDISPIIAVFVLILVARIVVPLISG